MVAMLLTIPKKQAPASHSFAPLPSSIDGKLLRKESFKIDSQLWEM